MSWCRQSKVVCVSELKTEWEKIIFLASSHPSGFVVSLEMSSQEFISSEYLKTRVSSC